MSDELEETYYLTSKASFVETDERALINLAHGMECITSVLAELLSGSINNVDDRMLALNMLEVANGFASAVEVYAEGKQPS